MFEQIPLAFDISTSPPEAIGYGIGAFIGILGGLLGIIKTIVVMLRPTANKVCLSGLLCFLIGWYVSLPVPLIERVYGPLERVIALVVAMVTAGFLMAGFVLGIVGLATFDRQRHTQGRSQAKWAIALSCIGGLLFLGGLVKGIQKERGTALSSAVGSVTKPMKMDKFNFEIRPSSEWFEMSPTAFNKAACIAMRKGRREVYGMVIAEKTDTVLEVETVKEVARTNLASASKVISQREENLKFDGVPFIHMETTTYLPRLGRNLAYEHWVGVYQGYAWQIIFYGSSSEQADVLASGMEVMKTFRVLDRTSKADAAQVVDVNRMALGYETHLANRGWSPWKRTDKNALEDFSVQRNLEALVVIPVRLDIELPDLEATARGLLSVMGFKYAASAAEFVSKPWHPSSGGEGLEITTEKEVSKTHYNYIARVARTKKSAVLLLGWAVRDKGSLDIVRRGLDDITLFEPKGLAPSMTAASEHAVGMVLNSAAISYEMRNRHEEAAQLMMKAFLMTKDAVVLRNVGEAFESAGKPAQGLEFMKPHMNNFQSSVSAVKQFARLNVLCDKPEEGNKQFLGLLDKGFKDEQELLTWLKLLDARHFQKEAIVAAEGWVKRLPSKESRRWLSQVIANAGEMPRAIAVLEKLKDDYPDDAIIACNLGEYYNEVDDNAKAAAVAEKLIAEGKDSTRAVMVLGWSQMGRGWFRDAKATFERAAKKAPTDDQVQEAIRRASAKLGQGDNSLVKEPLTPVPMPREIAEAMAELKSAKDFGKGHALTYLQRCRGFHFEKGKGLSETATGKVRVETKQGAKDFSSLHFSFDPIHERLFVNRVEVKDAEGKVKGRASVDDSYITDSQNGMATEEKTLSVQVPGVEPGCTVEWEVTKQEKSPPSALPFFRQLFAHHSPIVTEAVFVSGDVEGLKYETAHGDELKKITGKHVLGWVAADQEPVSYEPFQTPVESRLPMLWVSGDLGSWEKMGSEYLKKLESRIPKDSTVDELAQKLTKDLKTDREKIGAILRKVQHDIAYKAIEFGVRGRQPNSAAETLSLRYGDCKDHALLLHSLLKSVGIASQLALVNNDWQIQSKLPSMDQFNHMIVSVPALGRNRWIDATDKMLAAEDFQASGFWHSNVLVLDPKGARLEAPIEDGSSLFGSKIHSKRVLTPDGADWKVDETLTFTGYYASGIRYGFNDLPARSQLAKAQQILAEQGPAVVESIEFANLDDLARPAELHIKYRVTKAITTAGAKRISSVPALWEKDYFFKEIVKDRKTDFNCDYSLTFEAEVELHLPSQPDLDTLKQKAVGPFCEWSLKPTAEASKARLNFEFQAKTGKFLAKQYAEFQSDWEAAYRVWEKPIVWIERDDT